MNFHVTADCRHLHFGQQLYKLRVPVFCQWPMDSFGIHVVCEKKLLSKHLFSQQSWFWELGSGAYSSAVMCRRDTKLWMQTSIWPLSNGTLYSVDPRTWDPGTGDLGTWGPWTQEPNWHALCVCIRASVSTQAHTRNVHSMCGSVSQIIQMEYRLVRWNGL